MGRYQNKSIGGEMTDSLGKCSVCGKEAGVLYPLLPGEPAFCSSHHNPKDAGPFGADFTGPDDFDIPWEDLTYEEMFGKEKYRRETFIWTDRKGVEHKLEDIDNKYLQNIISLLKRKVESIPPFDYALKIGVVDTEREVSGLEALIEFLEEEQRERSKR